MKRFLMELFARHDWTNSGNGRHCATCGRRDMEQFEQSELSDSMEWHCVDQGDIRKHWHRALAVNP